MNTETRWQLVKFLKKELIGPDPVPPDVQENGEEILITEPPRHRYGAGILFPQDTTYEFIEQLGKKEEEQFEEASTVDEVSETDASTSQMLSDEKGYEYEAWLEDDIDFHDQAINLANTYMPSAMGLSCYIQIADTPLNVTINAGRYHSNKYKVASKSGEIRERTAFFRESLDTTLQLKFSDLPPVPGNAKEISVEKDGTPTGLVLNIRCRSVRSEFRQDARLYTFSLINTHQMSGSRDMNEKSFFQVEFEIRADHPIFFPYPSSPSVTEHEDDLSRRLLYRNHKTFAIGHGCAVLWGKSINNQTTWIKSSAIPIYELKPILPSHIHNLNLSMLEMSDLGNRNSMLTSLTALCDEYESWIQKQKETARQILSGELLQTADKHIENCTRCLHRMRKGVQLLINDNKVLRAFQLMNRAMLTQQLRYSLPLRKWKVKDKDELVLSELDIPLLEDKSTWLRSQEKLGKWRPFQIAFILINLISMTNSEDPERNIVDIIWFPTGGGKTEAYLGLTAFTIFLRRLFNQNDSGTCVLMRYTLRLLTTQQFQRAAALICACEMIRREQPSELGSNRISIGLWVGKSLTLNKRKEAIESLKKLNKDIRAENKFIVLKCPWCAAQMGPVQMGKNMRVIGYKQDKAPRQEPTVKFKCGNEDCEFSERHFTLPLLVIDQDIYDTPPSLLIGTVDKFALLPWFPETKALFGYRGGGDNVNPPDLIIQDELHLISGPLGSMVGHFETLISELCVNRKNTPHIKPKIIASTATISRAREQAHALYNCGKDNVFQFPPQCLDAGESFFAYEEKEQAGRLYAGIHASGLPSHATTQVRVFSALLQGTKLAEVENEKDRDPYWTLLGYFNSLRELGHAKTLIHADIKEYLNAVWFRKKLKKTDIIDPRRFINKDIELTSRVTSGEIPEYLQQLEVKYTGERDNYPVDICLATNMVSVGVDVGRLGLMTVTGQPKTTSEYIQATSRVGRASPGLVVMIYNPSKPRDRSHYENFITYHSTLYSQVEPTSVTPFSAPVRERALHALLVGFIRHFGTSGNATSPSAPIRDELITMIKEIIRSRVKSIDPEESNQTLQLLQSRLQHWQNCIPGKYGSFGKASDETPLMYPAGTVPHYLWQDNSWPTPSSMRNVDASCEARQITSYDVDFDYEEDNE